MSIRKGKPTKKSSRKSQKKKRRSYIQSSNYLVGEHGSYVELRDNEGNHFHIHKNYPEMFVMNINNNDDDYDVIVDGRYASLIMYEDYDEMYRDLKTKSRDPVWNRTLDSVWKYQIDV